MIEITPFKSEYIADAKRVIATVAQGIFEPEQSLEEFIEMIEREGELQDLENYREIYMENRGLLLAVLDDEKVIGTGGIRKLKEDVAELKRIWLLAEYHGQQIGFRVVSLLLDFAREQDYTLAYLETTRLNKRALGFYQKLGFYEIPSPYEDADAVSMELKL